MNSSTSNSDPTRDAPAIDPESTPASPPSFRRYVRWAAATIVVTLVLIATMNVLIDPFRIHPTLRVSALDLYRSDARPRVHNSLLARNGDYDLAFVGSSRAQRAFDPSSAALSGFRAVNLANPATSLPELVDVVRTIRSAAPQSAIVVALDFHAFHASRSYPQTYRVSFFSPSVHPAEFWIDKWVSQNTTRRSIKIFRRWRKDRRPAEWTPTPAERVIIDFAHGPLLWGDFRRATDDLELLQELIATPADNPGPLHLVILPMHASLLETLAHRGLWGEFEKWKRDLSEAANGRATLWDFATYSEPARLPLPESPNAPAPEYRRWFRDPSHITADFGSLILELILNPTATTAPWGRLLTRDTIDEHLRQIRQAQALYRSSTPTERHRLETWWNTPPPRD